MKDKKLKGATTTCGGGRVCENAEKGLKGTGESTSGGGRGAGNAAGMQLKVERRHVVGRVRATRVRRV